MRYIKSLVLLFFIAVFYSQIAVSEGYEVLDFDGKIALMKEGRLSFEIKENDIVEPGDVLRTYKNSTVIIGQGNKYFKIYPLSKVWIENDPVLVYGKLSQSGDKNFLDLHFSFTARPSQGKTFRVMVWSSEMDLIIESSIESQKGYRNNLKFYPLGDGVFRALTGFDLDDPPARYELKIRAKIMDDNYTEAIYPFYLRRTSYERGKVFLFEDKADLLGPSEEKNLEREVLSNIISQSSSEAFWDGSFNYPIRNPAIISSFGKRRVYYINNSPSFIRAHRGIDFVGEKGEPVFSPNRGMVVFTGSRITTGNTVVIDHGHNVYSLFFHLDYTSVQEGAFVEKGDEIGGIGSTGIAAGIHLHWGLLVNGIYVDPLDWIKRGF